MKRHSDNPLGQWVGERLDDFGNALSESLSAALPSDKWDRHFTSRSDSSTLRETSVADVEPDEARRDDGPDNSDYYDSSYDDEISSEPAEVQSAAPTRKPTIENQRPVESPSHVRAVSNRWGYCATPGECQCGLPKVCAKDECECKRERVCVREYRCECRRRRMCSDLNCSCGRPKVTLAPHGFDVLPSQESGAGGGGLLVAGVVVVVVIMMIGSSAPSRSIAMPEMDDVRSPPTNERGLAASEDLREAPMQPEFWQRAMAEWQRSPNRHPAAVLGALGMSMLVSGKRAPVEDESIIAALTSAGPLPPAFYARVARTAAGTNGPTTALAIINAGIQSWPNDESLRAAQSEFSR